MKTIVWEFNGPLTDIKGLRNVDGTVLVTGASFTHVVDRAYTPVRLSLRLGTAPVAGVLTVDINDDGVSLGHPVSLIGNKKVADGSSFALDPRIARDSELTLDFDSIPVGAEDLRVTLELME